MSTADRVIAVVGLIVLSTTMGCANRHLTIRTDPPGARVFLDREDVGRTPVVVPFIYGGTREFLILHEEGETKYRPVRLRQDVETFAYDTFPFDAFVGLGGGEDAHLVEVTLEPSTVRETYDAAPDVWSNALLERADRVRGRAEDLQLHGLPAAPPLLAVEEPKESGEISSTSTKKTKKTEAVN